MAVLEDEPDANVGEIGLPRRPGTPVPIVPEGDDSLPPVLTPTPGPTPPLGSPSPSSVSQDQTVLPLDTIGDIPPPPIPAPPKVGGGLAGAPGAATFARPGTAGARPFRTPAFSAPNRGPRFGPGIPNVGGAPATAAVGDDTLGLEADDVGEILRRLAAGGGGL